ncbi:hypothetical protein BZG36_03322 [Bifiguratus adelaidae]|uniref:Uncharacterized protein n=1 Tax=Bifiguratus adelaidae TaxID=1938954 RepID=A0A261XXT5_9FUNG|nr:hypothetical protein BZG36_03322 [Bifiguratus adelaidae]
MHEIITLQFGHYANYIGTHFWNAQEAYFSYGPEADAERYGVIPEEELDHDVLFRVGRTLSGQETYTPRVLIYDLKGGFGSSRHLLQAYSQVDAPADIASTQTAGPKLERFETAAPPLNEYQQQVALEHQGDQNVQDIQTEIDLDSVVLTWADFSRAYYHPKSMIQVDGWQLGDTTFRPFDSFIVGKEAWVETEAAKDTYEENLRIFAEECDSLQGFQLFTTVHDAWGGFASGCLENLQEDYGKKSIMIYAAGSPSSFPSSERMSEKQHLNKALSLAHLADKASCYIPLEPSVLPSRLSKYVEIKRHLPFHTSAILATAIEVISTPYRAKKNRIPMQDIISRVNWRLSTKLANLDIILPLPILGNNGKVSLSEFPSVSTSCAFGSTKVDSKAFGESISVRGVPSGSVLTDIASVVSKAIDTFSIRYSTPLSHPVPTSYPKIFRHLDVDGRITSSNTSVPRSIPVLSRLETHPIMAKYIQAILDGIEEVDIRKLSDYNQGAHAVEQDDIAVLKEELWTLSQEYKDAD